MRPTKSKRGRQKARQTRNQGEAGGCLDPNVPTVSSTFETRRDGRCTSCAPGTHTRSTCAGALRRLLRARTPSRKKFAAPGHPRSLDGAAPIGTAAGGACVTWGGGRGRAGSRANGRRRTGGAEATTGSITWRRLGRTRAGMRRIGSDENLDPIPSGALIALLFSPHLLPHRCCCPCRSRRCSRRPPSRRPRRRSQRPKQLLLGFLGPRARRLPGSIFPRSLDLIWPSHIQEHHRLTFNCLPPLLPLLFSPLNSRIFKLLTLRSSRSSPFLTTLPHSRHHPSTHPSWRSPPCLFLRLSPATSLHYYTRSPASHHQTTLQIGRAHV